MGEGLLNKAAFRLELRAPYTQKCAALSARLLLKTASLPPLTPPEPTPNCRALPRARLARDCGRRPRISQCSDDVLRRVSDEFLDPKRGK
jgi:hypothetical protein